MFTRPDDRLDREVVEAVREGWGLPVVRAEYAAVGFGSHHWIASEEMGRGWFVTVDFDAVSTMTVDHDADSLRNALRSAQALADAGMSGLVAPLPASDGGVLRRCQSARRGYAVSVYPLLESMTLSEHGSRDRDVVALLADLHARTDVVRGIAEIVSLRLPARDGLERRLVSLVTPWRSGPYGERARGALAAAEAEVWAGLEEYDRLVEGIDKKGWVITHGEPHDRNLLVTDEGLALIDWDTARIAPAARDLWHVGGGQLVSLYTELTGRNVATADLELFRLRWDLTELIEYAAEFSGPHDETDDAAEGFAGFLESLEHLVQRAHGAQVVSGPPV